MFATYLILYARHSRINLIFTRSYLPIFTCIVRGGVFNLHTGLCVREGAGPLWHKPHKPRAGRSGIYSPIAYFRPVWVQWRTPALPRGTKFAVCRKMTVLGAMASSDSTSMPNLLLFTARARMRRWTPCRSGPQRWMWLFIGRRSWSRLSHTAYTLAGTATPENGPSTTGNRGARRNAIGYSHCTGLERVRQFYHQRSVSGRV